MNSDRLRARTHSLSQRLRSGISAAGRRAEEPGSDAQDHTDAAQRLREACHDMRQPVAGVLALAGAALSEPALPGTVRARLEQIVQQAEWLADMIQDRLHAAQPGEPGHQSGSGLGREGSRDC